MKKALLFAGVVLFIAACGQQPAYKVSGTIEGLSGTVIMKTLDSDGEFSVIDSTEAKEGVFTFDGYVPAPQMAVLTLAGKRGPRFFLENSAITIKGQLDSLKNIQINGSISQDILKSLDDKMAESNKAMMALYPAYQKAREANDEKTMEEISKKAQDISKKQEKIQLSFTKDNLDNAVGPYMVYRQLMYSLELNEIQEFATSFKGAAKNTIYYTLLNKSIKTLAAVAIGQVAPDFEMESPDGSMIKLSSFRGKYLLIDFWASWCSPCRGENPNVVKMYNKVKDKDFTILGVSLDESRENWLKAIKDDKLTWNHVSDLKGWKNRIAQLYGVKGIPHTVLLDKEGVIIAKDLRGEELKTKIFELVK